MSLPRFALGTAVPVNAIFVVASITLAALALGARPSILPIASQCAWHRGEAGRAGDFDDFFEKLSIACRMADGDVAGSHDARVKHSAQNLLSALERYRLKIRAMSGDGRVALWADGRYRRGPNEAARILIARELGVQASLDRWILAHERAAFGARERARTHQLPSRGGPSCRGTCPS